MKAVVNPLVSDDHFHQFSTFFIFPTFCAFKLELKNAHIIVIPKV